MNHLRFFVIGLISFWLTFSIKSQNEKLLSNYQFQHISESDGLSDDRVHCGLLDSKGYMWFGTHAGLSRWDGIAFQNYLPDSQDSTSIAGSLITSLLEDKDGYIWIGSHHVPLCRLDPDRGVFEYFPFQKDEGTGTLGGVMKIYQDSDGIIWIGGFDQGLFRFNPKQETFQQYSLANLEEINSSFRQNSILDIMEDIEDTNILWLAGNNGLYRFEKDTEQITHYPSTIEGTKGTSVQSLLMMQENEVWMATYGMGVVRFIISEERWEYFMPDKSALKNRNFNFNIMLGIAPKSEQELWVTSETDGIGIFNITTHKFSFFEPNTEDPHAVINNSGYKVYKDATDRTWFFMKEKGVSYLDPVFQNFKFHSLQSGSKTIPTPFQVKDILFDEETERLFVLGRGKNGLYDCSLDGEVHRTIPLKGYEAKSQIFNKILKTENGSIIVAGGHSRAGVDEVFVKRPSLLRYNEAIQKLVPIKSPSIKRLELQKKDIIDLIEYQPNELWGITSKDELFWVHSVTGEAIIYSLDDPKYHQLSFQGLVNPKAGTDFYISSNRGLFRFDTALKQFTSFRFMDDIRSLCDWNGQLWMGSKELMVFDLESQQLVPFNNRINAPKVSIDQIFLDSQNRLWCTTQGGLYYFHEDKERFIHFGADNGLDKEFFFHNGICQLPNGQLLLGKENGIYSFQSDQLLQTLQSNRLAFSSLTINDKVYPLIRDKDEYQPLQLSHEENSIRIGYSPLAFSNQLNHQLAYKLEGVDKQWVLPKGNKNQTIYNTLASDEYLFRLKEVNNDGMEISLSITIAPPWYRSWWAYAGYGLIILGLFYWLNQFLLRKKVIEHEAHRLKELNQFKTKLYTNITHEFRTPLTVISGMANLIEQEAPKKLIQKNSDNLLNLVNQMLDLSKLEAGQLHPNYIQSDVVPYLKYIVSSFQSYAEAQQKTIHLTSDVKEHLMDYEPEFLKRILSNLIANALKFTTEGERVEVTLSLSETEEEKLFSISVQDNGVGIESSQISKIFDRFYQVDSPTQLQEEGTGIGLTLVKELVELLNGTISVDSELGQWTDFTILLPITNQAALQEVNKEYIITPTIANSLPVPKISSSNGNNEKDDLPVLLIMEDNEDVLFYLQSVLRKKYQLLLATNGKIGVDKAIQHVPDIIISDVMMPEMDGYQVCNHLKKSEKTSHIPIILLTAKANQSDKLEGLTHGADVYLTKPFDEEELLIRLRQLVENKKRVQSFFQQNNNIPTDLPVEHEFIQKVQRIIADNYKKDSFALPQLCELLHLSRTQVFRKVKALTDQSPSEMILKHRLEQAKHLLITTDLSVTEIAFQIGFKTQAHFSSSFKKYFGISPSQQKKAV